MNGTHVRSKLKIRNRILAIAVAFLLLTLMVPTMSFADGATDQSKDITAEEVNNAEDNAAAANEGEPTANAVIVTGTVTDGNGAGIEGVSMSAFLGNTRVCDYDILSTTGGNFSITLYESVQSGDPILIMANYSSYAFEVIATTADSSSKSIALKEKAATTIKTISDQTDRFANFTFDSIIGEQTSSQTITNPSFNHNFPVGGQFYMSDRAHMYFTYTNCLNQDVIIHITANGNQWYKQFFWGAYLNEDQSTAFELRVNTPYTLESGTTYTLLPWFQGLAMLDFSSASEGHDTFNINYEKNGAPYVNLTQASFQNTTYEGAICSVCENGSIKVYFDDSDPVNTYNVVGYITPNAKAGFKFTNWTYNGETLKTGDSFTAETALNMAFVANYEVDASKAPATGDFPFVWVIVLAGIALASVGGVLYFRKNH